MINRLQFLTEQMSRKNARETLRIRPERWNAAPDSVQLEHFVSGVSTHKFSN